MLISAICSQKSIYAIKLLPVSGWLDLQEKILESLLRKSCGEWTW